MTKAHDRELGMDRRITRRDFLDGVSVAVTGSLLVPRWLEAFGLQEQAYYPPSETGLRGDHPGSFEVGHQLRDGRSWDTVGAEAETGEAYDLVVVGGGFSGLAGAYFFRKAAGPAAKILVLDNHEDFGGHAARNEFQYNGRLLMLNGGVLNLEAPYQYSVEAGSLLREVGVDIDRFYATIAPDRDLYRSLNLSRGVFFDKETFGEDRLVAGQPGGSDGPEAWTEWLAKTPLSEVACKDIARLYDDKAKKDCWLGLSSEEKKARLARMSYRDFLLHVAQVHPDVIPFFQTRTHSLFCMGIDAIPALYCWEMGGFPGFQGMGIGPTPPKNLIDEPGGQHGRENEERASRGGQSMHFPDGSATVARLLVRALLPKAVPGTSMEDVTMTRVDYGVLDKSDSPTRIRLNSMAVRVKHLGDPVSAKEIEVTYVKEGKAQKVRGGACILACWNSVIPHLCPELPEPQKKALSYGTKAPIVYTTVLIRDWTSFQKLGVSGVSAPGGYHTSVSLSEPVSIGGYRAPRTPNEPMTLHLVRTPCQPGLTKREQHLAGRRDLLTTSFETFERKIRDQLGRMLSGGGFDPARDIKAITVNRWPHGYAYTYNTLFDPIDWALDSPDDRPCVIGRKPFGRIAIANSDAAASPHVDAAFNEAFRAVREIWYTHAL